MCKKIDIKLKDARNDIPSIGCIFFDYITP